MKKIELLNFAGNSDKLLKEITRRLRQADKSLNNLCAATGVSISTLWRWRSEGSRPNVATISKLETQLTKWERHR